MKHGDNAALLQEPSLVLDMETMLTEYQMNVYLDLESLMKLHFLNEFV